MFLLTVIPLTKKVRKDALTYWSAKEAPPGMVVSVPVRSSETLALVVDSRPAALSKADIKRSAYSLKKIAGIRGWSPFSPSFIEAARATSKRFVMPEGAVLASFSPAWFREAVLPAPDKKTSATPARHLLGEKLVFQAPLRERILYYKTFIRQSFARKKSVFLAVPTASLAERLAERLKKGIEEYVVVVHGGMAKADQALVAAQVQDSGHPLLVVGTPGACSLAPADTGTFIIENEHADSYRAVVPPHPDGRVFIEILADKYGARLILGDTLLSTETIGRHYEGRFAELAPLSFRKDPDGPAEEIVDSNARESAADGRTREWRIFPEKTEAAIRKCLAGGGRVLLFALRKGLASSTVCSNCESVLSCDGCDAPFVLSRDQKAGGAAFICPRCKKRKDSLTICPVCGNWNLVPLGIGTDRVVDAAQKLFPSAPVFQADADTAKTEKARESIKEEWLASKGSILVSSRGILPLLERNADLGVVVSFDSLFSIPDFRINDRIIRLLDEVRLAVKDKLIIQTKNPDDPVLKTSRASLLVDFCRGELEERKRWEYPPYTRIIKILWEGSSAASKAAKLRLTEMLRGYSPAFVPKSSYGSRKAGFAAIIRVPSGTWSLPEERELGTLDERLYGALASLPLEFTVVIDPAELF